METEYSDQRLFQWGLHYTCCFHETSISCVRFHFSRRQPWRSCLVGCEGVQFSRYFRFFEECSAPIIRVEEQSERIKSGTEIGRGTGAMLFQRLPHTYWFAQGSGPRIPSPYIPNPFSTLRLFLYPEDGSMTFHRNVAKYLREYMESHS